MVSKEEHAERLAKTIPLCVQGADISVRTEYEWDEREQKYLVLSTIVLDFPQVLARAMDLAGLFPEGSSEPETPADVFRWAWDVEGDCGAPEHNDWTLPNEGVSS